LSIDFFEKMSTDGNQPHLPSAHDFKSTIIASPVSALRRRD
jgi:hypothetical protein